MQSPFTFLNSLKRVTINKTSGDLIRPISVTPLALAKCNSSLQEKYIKINSRKNLIEIHVLANSLIFLCIHIVYTYRLLLSIQIDGTNAR